MVAAALIFDLKRVYADGAIVQMRIWRVHASVRGSQHDLKYSLFYGIGGQRFIGYDNEAGKGDHRHYGDHEEVYAFRSVEQLVADFLSDVEALRSVEQ